jgi:hypothetical protein
MMQAMLEPEFSVLRDFAMRPLPVALAHRLVNAKPDDPYLEIFHRLYESLATSDRTRCLAEMVQQSSLASAAVGPGLSSLAPLYRQSAIVN